MSWSTTKSLYQNQYLGMSPEDKILLVLPSVYQTWAHRCLNRTLPSCSWRFSPAGRHSSILVWLRWQTGAIYNPCCLWFLELSRPTVSHPRSFESTKNEASSHCWHLVMFAIPVIAVYDCETSIWTARTSCFRLYSPGSRCGSYSHAIKFAAQRAWKRLSQISWLICCAMHWSDRPTIVLASVIRTSVDALQHLSLQLREHGNHAQPSTTDPVRIQLLDVQIVHQGGTLARWNRAWFDYSICCFR